MKERRVTVLIGAGAAIDIGAPSTAQITEKVIRKPQGIFKGETQYTLKGIYKLLNSYYRDHRCNFEDIFHALEMLSSCNAAQGDRTVYKFKPSIFAFVNPNKHYRRYAPFLGFAENDLLFSIAEQISIYDEQFKCDKNDISKWYCNFWSKSGLVWDIATLNYDTTIEESLDNYIDGFQRVKGCDFSRFYPTKLIRYPNNHTCIHLHGCINYGYPRNVNPNKYIFEDDFHDLYKLNNYKEACQTWSGRSQSVTQAGERNHIAPIVTGLRKLEKLNVAPYSHYLHFFHDSLLKNPCLLVVGYGFGDFYLNQLMERMNIIHGKKKRIVIIGYYPYELYDPRIFGAPSLEEYHFICRQFRIPQLGNKGYFEREKAIISDDKSTMLYLDGFMNTVSRHWDEIIEFFNS